MCTVVILRRPGHAWPLLLAANRDEALGRPWRKPDRHWPDRPNVIAGLDEDAGGSWLGMNDEGVVAAVLNRSGSLGPAPNKRSRGELVLDALDHADAGSAAEALADLDGRSYRSFNLVVADSAEAFWLRHDGTARLRFQALPAGISMLTAHELNDPRSPRTTTYLPRFRAAPVPSPDTEEWQAWQALLASTDRNGGGPGDAMCVEPTGGFGTVNASLIAVPPAERHRQTPIWLFSDGPPNRNNFVKTNL